MRTGRRRQRGFSFVELMTTLGIMGMVIFTAVNMLLMGLRTSQKVNADVSLHTKNAQSMRRLTESLRGAMTLTLGQNHNGTEYTLTFRKPQLSSTKDPITNEYEIREPLVAEATGLTYKITFPNPSLKNGVLTDPYGRVLVRNIFGKDPEAKSTQHNKAYSPFQLTTIGSLRAVTINVVTEDDSKGKPVYMRLKTTVVLRNSG